MNQATCCVLAVEKGRYELRYERVFSRPFAPQAKKIACDLAFWGSRPCFYAHSHYFLCTGSPRSHWGRGARVR